MRNSIGYYIQIAEHHGSWTACACVLDDQGIRGWHLARQFVIEYAGPESPLCQLLTFIKWLEGRIDADSYRRLASRWNEKAVTVAVTRVTKNTAA